MAVKASQQSSRQPAKYRKKPVEITAVLCFSGTPVERQLLMDALRTMGARTTQAGGGQPVGAVWWRCLLDGTWVCVIHTLEGEMIARPGDWIIRGVQGEFYPCKPDIFEQTYDTVML